MVFIVILDPQNGRTHYSEVWAESLCLQLASKLKISDLIIEVSTYLFYNGLLTIQESRLESRLSKLYFCTSLIRHLIIDHSTVHALVQPK